MTTNLSKHVSRKSMPQTEPVPGKVMVANNAGGFTFQITPWQRLDRFLILGSEKGTYYVGEHELTKQNAVNVSACIKLDGPRTVARIVEVSDKGLAPKNDPAIFALALCCADGDEKTRKAAYAAITKVCRIGTHIFQFCQAIKDLRKWSRGLRTGVARFYTEKKSTDLAYQLIKYRQRDGWTHKDVMILAHPNPKGNPVYDSLFSWAVLGKHKSAEVGTPTDDYKAIVAVKAFEDLQMLSPENKHDITSAILLMRNHKLPWEAMPTAFHKVPEVWEALLPTLPMTALIRNLGRLSSLGILDSNLSEATKTVTEKLLNKEALKKARIHPISLLNAIKTYSQGHGDKGSMKWKAVQKVVDALDDAFYLTFDLIESTGQNWLLALDVSGSMTDSQGFGALMACEVTAAMAMVTARTEKNYEILGFTDTLKDLGISAKDRLDTVSRKIRNLDFGSTDCSQPVLWALQRKVKIDTFTVYTDNETYAGETHVFQALNQYRAKVNPEAKLIVVATASTNFTIADPDDPGMLDVCGFSPDVPALMADFSRQKLV